MELAYVKMLEEIIEGCVKKDRLSQKRLYERFYGRMIGVCMRYASGRDQATEMLNTGFFKVFETIDVFHKRQGGNIEAWIYRIMINNAIDHLRRESRHQHQEIGPSIHIHDHSDIVADMSAAEIMELVNKLSPSYRAVFNLHVVEGYNHKEIGEMLGINEGTSKSNLAKAKAKLQEQINKQLSAKSAANEK